MSGPEKTVVVTGCFQKFHRGHASLLKKASKFGRVTVLLNSDDGILSLKGYLAEPFEIRKARLLETGLVYQVLGFFKYPADLLRQLQPDYLICGDDHSESEVRWNGGCYAKNILILPYTKGVSSTQLYEESKCQR